MGQANIPIGESFRKVNDGKYHVLKFVRSGANSSLQVDNWERYTKTPQGKPFYSMRPVSTFFY